MFPLSQIWFHNVPVRNIFLVLIFLKLTGGVFAALGSILKTPKLPTIDPLEPAEDVIGFFEKVSPNCVLAKGVCPRKLAKFWLYSSDNRSNPVEIDWSRPSYKARWLPDCDLKILIHGYTSDKNAECVQILVSAYLGDECRCHNVVVLDWGPLCRAGCYFVAIQNLHSVAMCVRDLVVAVKESGVLNKPCVHVIGHSLGAHIASYSSLYVKLCKCTELDPAGPLISPQVTTMTMTPVRKVCDVYHTNVGVLEQRETSGKVDAYFNNGASQPGCGCVIGCSHSMVCRYFAESVNCCKPMLALRSDGWWRFTGGDLPMPDFYQPPVALGECIDPTLSGVFVVLTNKNKSSPYLPSADVYNFAGDEEERCSRYQRAVDVNNECKLAPVIGPTFGLINKS